MQEDIWKIIGILVVGLLLGAATGYVLGCLVLFCLFVIVWQIYRLNSLSKWVDRPAIKSVPDADGQIYTILRKLAKRDKKNKLRQRQLTSFLSQVRKAIGALPDAIVLIDESGKIEWANNNASTLLGIRWPADNGLRLTDLVRYPELDALLEAQETTTQGLEVASMIKRDVVLNLKCLAYTEQLRMVIVRDVTRLVRTNQMQRDFVANVSHELKTPLTVLRGYIEILSDHKELPKGFAKPLAQMNAQSTRMELIVSDLLFLAKLESTQYSSEDDPVDISQLVQAAVDNVQPLIVDKQHTLNVDLDPTLHVLGSATELHSAISNLLTNAIHYTPTKGIITISWKNHDDVARLSVKDNGDGIEDHHLERLTQRFYRVDSNRSREGGGTGLGLAIVKHVLQRHNAELRIKSRVSEGSEFICEFPAAQTLKGSLETTQKIVTDTAQVTRIY
ncbi:MAG: phosphate regulon sensor histidine kinase PhoR [Arenicella sp.]|nr:phosphate regulon sensor histidine kinase PhoR [Arenicella sp.]HAU68590.1 phosphate regulon sensor histidine kinase PhoR [Gammaproteobacteria bacterium]